MLKRTVNRLSERTGLQAPAAKFSHWFAHWVWRAFTPGRDETRWETTTGIWSYTGTNCEILARRQ